jgi:hypothetical protein
MVACVESRVGGAALTDLLGLAPAGALQVGSQFGWSVSVAASGSHGLVGEPQHGKDKKAASGAAWAFE